MKVSLELFFNHLCVKPFVTCSFGMMPALEQPHKTVAIDLLLIDAKRFQNIEVILSSLLS